jgi:hypothetical protein
MGQGGLCVWTRDHATVSHGEDRGVGGEDSQSLVFIWLNSSSFHLSLSCAVCKFRSNLFQTCFV